MTLKDVTNIVAILRDEDQGGFDLKSLQPALPGPTPFQNLQDFQLQLQLHQFLKNRWLITKRVRGSFWSDSTDRCTIQQCLLLMANTISTTSSANLVLPPRLPGLAQPLLPPFSFPPEPIFPLPHPAPIYGHPFRHPLMVSQKPKAREYFNREKNCSFQGLQPPVPSPVLLPSQTSFEHRFVASPKRSQSPKFKPFSHLSPGHDDVLPPPKVQNLKVPQLRTVCLPTEN